MELEKSAEQVVPGREGGEWGGWGWKQKGQMTKTVYAHVNK
jgi:hypothetical protein